jgi:hypothetical protein
MWTDRNGRARLVGRIGYAVLCGARKHVDDARLSVGRLGFVSNHIRNPLSRRLVRTRCGTVENFWVASLAREAVAAFAQNRSLALCISADDPGEVGNVTWTRSYRPSHLDICWLARSTADLICVDVTVIVRLLHLRSEGTSLAQEQTSQKDDDRGVPSGELHKYSSLEFS